MRNLMSAAAIAVLMITAPANAAWHGPQEQWAGHARYTCDVMMADLDTALKYGLELGNSDSTIVTWVMNTFASGSSPRAARLAGLRVANQDVHLAGGGRGGYFSNSGKAPEDYPIGPNDAPSTMKTVHDTLINFFQINVATGASCDLNDW
jgi:hypothetical protein